jgi:putative NIF3 family GTP cyclohydrolase 1 type 2
LEKERVMLTIEYVRKKLRLLYASYHFVYSLTPAVLREAIFKKSSVIIAYHPPLFRPISSITLSNPLQASLLQCVQAGISIYSPHTALDAARGGVNDWLVSCFYGIGPMAEVKCVQENVPETNAAKADTTSKTVPLSNGTIGMGRIMRFVEGAKMREIIGEAKRQLGLQQGEVIVTDDTSSALIRK